MLIEILTILASVLVGYQAKQNPWRAICLIVFLLPTYVIRFPLFGIPTNTVELLLVGTLIGTLWPRERRRAYWQVIKKINSRIKIWAILFLATALVSTLVSSQFRVSLGILKGWIVAPLLLAGLVYGARSSADQKRQLLYALIASATTISCVALVMGKVEGRLQALYDTPNSLALYIAPVLAATFWQAETGRKNKGYLVMAAAIQVLALIGSQSVGAALAVIISLSIGTSLWLKKGKRQALAVLCGATLVAIWLLWQSGKIPYLLQPLTNPAVHTSASVRQQLWSVSWDLIKEHPLLGVGLGQFEPHYQVKLHERFARYSLNPTLYLQPPLSEFVFRDPHNWVFAFYLNLGLTGLASFIALNVLVLKKTHHKQPSVHASYYVLLITYLLVGLVDTIYWKNDLAALWWLTIAVLL